MVTSSATKVVGADPEEAPVTVVVHSSTVLVVVSCSSAVVVVVGAAIQCKGYPHNNTCTVF